MSTATLPLPTDELDEALLEFVDGDPVEKSVSAGTIRIASRISRLMGEFVESNCLGGVDSEMLFVLDPLTRLKRRPDVSFVSARSWPIDREPPMEGDWELAPDLAIEVVSPNDVGNSVVGKVSEYFEHGVRQVWLVWPEEMSVYVYDSPTDVRIVAAPDVLETALIPGWKLPLGELFKSAPTDRSRP